MHKTWEGGILAFDIPYSDWHCLGVREYVQQLNTMTSFDTILLFDLAPLTSTTTSHSHAIHAAHMVAELEIEFYSCTMTVQSQRKPIAKLDMAALLLFTDP